MSVCKITFTRNDCTGTEFSYYDTFDDTMKIGHVNFLMEVHKLVKKYLKKENGSAFDSIVRIEDLEQPKS